MHASGLHFLSLWLRRRSPGLCGGLVSLLCYGTCERVQALCPRSNAFHLSLDNTTPVADEVDDKVQYRPAMLYYLLHPFRLERMGWGKYYYMYVFTKNYVRLQCSTWPPARLEKFSYPRFTLQRRPLCPVWCYWLPWDKLGERCATNSPNHGWPYHRESERLPPLSQ